MALWAPPCIYAAMLVAALGMGGRLFHPVDSLWKGVAWCLPFSALTIAFHLAMMYMVDARASKLLDSENMSPAESPLRPLEEGGDAAENRGDASQQQPPQ